MPQILENLRTELENAQPRPGLCFSAEEPTESPLRIVGRRTFQRTFQMEEFLQDSE